jgi:osmotically-inducible protein OsmY
MRQNAAPWLVTAALAVGLTVACNREAQTPKTDLPPRASDALEGAQSDLQDGWLTTKIEAKYFADPDVKGRRIDVTTENGVVTLTGSVDDESARQKALAIARDTNGVVRVQDRLTSGAVATSGTAAGDARRDDAPHPRVGDPVGNAWLTTKIQGKYFLDQMVKGRRVDVSTNNGVVTLSGTVNSEHEKQKAVEIARNTDGVRRVEDRLKVAPGTDRTPPVSGETRTGDDSTFTEQMSDAGITARVQSKFFLDDVVKARDIDVSTSAGVVTLQGHVTSDGERQQAIALARSVGGVQDVKDQLQVRAVAASPAPAPGEPGVGVPATVEDPWITTKIQSKYFMDDLVKAGQIGVTTSAGVVTLTGHVPSADARARAEALALETDGVTRVENRLTIDAQARSSAATPPAP